MRAALVTLALISALAHAGSRATIEIRGYVAPRTSFSAPDGGSASFGDEGARWESNEGATMAYEEDTDAGVGHVTVYGP